MEMSGLDTANRSGAGQFFTREAASFLQSQNKQPLNFHVLDCNPWCQSDSDGGVPHYRKAPDWTARRLLFAESATRAPVETFRVTPPELQIRAPLPNSNWWLQKWKWMCASLMCELAEERGNILRRHEVEVFRGECSWVALIEPFLFMNPALTSLDSPKSGTGNQPLPPGGGEQQ